MEILEKKFRVVKRVGSGSFGEIYSGTVVYQDSNQQVAIKFDRSESPAMVNPFEKTINKQMLAE
mgnify:CR=1 FL=1